MPSAHATSPNKRKIVGAYSPNAVRDLVDIPENWIRENFSESFLLLIKDKTTGRNIIWATRDYDNFQGNDLIRYSRGERDELIPEDITQNFIKPRCVKDKNLQRSRTRERAEVFTPAWICNAQNNLVDEAWFGKKCVFNKEKSKEKSWRVLPPNSKNRNRITFPEGKTWQDYVRLNRMEIACGEAPYLASRYDSTRVQKTPMPLHRRIGLLDRKLRVVSENTEIESDFFEWAKRAFQSIYAFEFQGDNLLLARENLLFTFYDFFYDKFSAVPSEGQMAEIAEIIAWNVFQMDAFTHAVPFSAKENDLLDGDAKLCKVKDWETGKIIEFRRLLNNEIAN